MPGISNISIIGLGNVGSYFTRTLKNSSFSVRSFSRQAVAGSYPLERLSEFAPETDLLLLCVSDKAIGEVSENIPEFQGILAHVAGAAPLSYISARHKRRAVFYPLMSLKADAEIPLSQIPFCLEADSEKDLEWLEQLTESLGAKSYRIDSEQRKYLHLAAVISQNFSNHLYHKAFEILKNQEMDPRVLLPLLENSLHKLHRQDPRELQTGPALRHDHETIQKHLQLLENNIDKNIYSLLSKSIQLTHDKKL